tara:strand:+ start:1529 stop:2140 length:612 start_codon:yes stop_codon:yes gene_type:complete
MPVIYPAIIFETSTAHVSNCATLALRLSRKHGDTITLAPQTQAAELVPSINRLLEKHAISYSDLACLITTVGPGTFTGIRIGLAVARMIAFTQPQLQALGITTLQAAAMIQPPEIAELCVALRAGKGDLYMQRFQHSYAVWQATSPITLCKPDALPDLPIISEPATATQIADHLDQLPPDAALPLEPLYIRPPDAKLPVKPLL